MIVMFQYRGKAYTFDCVDETLLDIEQILADINKGKVQDMGMKPSEVTEFLRLRKEIPGMGEGTPS